MFSLELIFLICWSLSVWLLIWLVFSIFWAISPNFTMQRISVVFESCTCFTVLRKKNLYSHSCSTSVSDVDCDSRNAYRCDSITYVRIIQSTKRFKIFFRSSIVTNMSGIVIRVRYTSSAYLAHPPSWFQPCEHNRSKEGFVCARWDSAS